MKTRALLLAASAVIVLVVMAWAQRYSGVPMGLWIFLASSLTSQLFDLLLALMLAAALVIGLVRQAGRRGADASPILSGRSWIGPLFGVLAGAREGSIIWFTMQMTHVTHFRIVAPTVVEALLMPALGLLAGAAAAAFASPRAKA